MCVCGCCITLSAEPVARMNSLYGLKDRQLTSAVWASTAWLGLEVLLERVSPATNQREKRLLKSLFQENVENVS